METTHTDLVRARLAIVGLVVGPLLVAASATLNVRLPSGTLRQDFDTMGAHAGSILAQDLLETVGFAVLLGALAAIALLVLRGPGAALGTAGTLLAGAGVVGFALSNAAGLTVVALAGLSDQDAAFDAAVAVTSRGPLAALGGVGFLLEIAGQLGILAVLGGLVRAHVLKWWVLAVLVVGIALNAAGGSMAATLVADLLLVALMGWIARTLITQRSSAPAPEPVRV